MDVSVELSMYPLNPSYGTPILEFIERLNKHEGIRVETNSMSTQVFGPFEKVMGILQKEILFSFTTEPTVVVVIKMVNQAL